MANSITGRLLSFYEVESIWSIDRAEAIERSYELLEGKLQLKDTYHKTAGWSEGEPEKYNPEFEQCYDRGGWFYGLFEAEKIIGAAILSDHFVGKGLDQLQLKFLHISQSYRQQGLGKRLVTIAKEEAKHRGAEYLYVSATPTQRTIDFYLSCGFDLVKEPEPSLLTLEPTDIHMICSI